MNLKNKIVIITGGSQGLGEALAYTIAKKHATVVICSLEKKALKQVCDKIKNQSGTCDYVRVDITKKTEVKKFIASVLKKYKKIDVLINNAGWAGDLKLTESVTDKEYEKSIATNLAGLFYFLRATLPIMKKRRQGTIITITSTAGTSAHPLAPIYSAAKFAARGLMQAVAKSIIDSRIPIKTLTVAPGGMNTRMRTKLFGEKDAARQQSPEAVALIIKDILIGKIPATHGEEFEIKNGKITLSAKI